MGLSSSPALLRPPCQCGCQGFVLRFLGWSPQGAHGACGTHAWSRHPSVLLPPPRGWAQHHSIQLILMPHLQVLNALDTTWATMEFEYEPHSRTQLPLLKMDEVLIETLEDNQMQLQNVLASKYRAFFLQRAQDWQQKLSTSDTVINTWFEVQRKWSHLETIFIASEDTRSQLPEDSKKFDAIDKDFRVRSPFPLSFSLHLSASLGGLKCFSSSGTNG